MKFFQDAIRRVFPTAENVVADWESGTVSFELSGSHGSATLYFGPGGLCAPAAGHGGSSVDFATCFDQKTFLYLRGAVEFTSMMIEVHAHAVDCSPTSYASVTIKVTLVGVDFPRRS